MIRKLAAHITSFNTQPPEGGWRMTRGIVKTFPWFQHTAARRRLGKLNIQRLLFLIVSTHSRLKAAGRPANTI